MDAAFVYNQQRALTQLSESFKVLISIEEAVIL